MTKEEASKIISAKIDCMKRETSGTDLDCNYRNCDECELCYVQGTTGEQIEALDMAIEALQAQATLDDVSNAYENGYKQGKFEAQQSQQKTGKWINANAGRWNICDVLKCSACGVMDNRMYRTDNYCPNCGAFMEEE